MRANSLGRARGRKDLRKMLFVLPLTFMYGMCIHVYGTILEQRNQSQGLGQVNDLVQAEKTIISDRRADASAAVADVRTDFPLSFLPYTRVVSARKTGEK